MDSHNFCKEEVKINEEGEFEGEFEGVTQKCKQLILSLPKVKGGRTPNLYLFQQFWCAPQQIQEIISAQTHFDAHDSDVVIATIPKSGTTWLKALVFAIVNRHQFEVNSNEHPLLRSNPHELVPFLEYTVYANNQIPNLSNLASPRILSSHMPYHSLPPSMIKSTCNCKIVYICRNPFDTFVSLWHFLKKIRPTSLGSLSLEEAFDMYCMGQVECGPNWVHMLEYLEESKKSPKKVIFLKYEDLKADAPFQIRRIAEFLGYPFSSQEENDGVVDGITKLCSFENLSDLDVNKNGKIALNVDKNDLFRKGEVGDWVNLFSKDMVERLTKITNEKLAGSGLEFPNIPK